MLRRRLTALAATAAVLLSGLTFGAAPASAAVTGAAISPSSWPVGTATAATITWTESASRSTVMVRSPWPWPNSYPGTVGTPATVSATVSGGSGQPWVITCPRGVFTLPAGSTVSGTIDCKSANSPGSPDFFTAFWIVAGSESTLTYTGAVQVDVASGAVTAPGTPRTDTWIVGQYSTANTAGGISDAGNVEVATSAVAVDAAGNPIPTITIDIDPNGGTCTTAKVSALEGTWVLAPDVNSCSRPGSTFTGFNTSADGSGLAIAPGGNLHLTSDNRLFAIYAEPRVPGTPTDVVAVAGRNAVKVSWKAPVDAGTFPITNFLAQATPSGRVCVTRQSDADMLSCTFELPATNTQYSFSVQALNGAGWGELSAASSAVSPYDFGMIEASRPNVVFGLGGTKVEASGSAPGLAGKAVTAEYKVGSQRDWTTQANAATVNAQGKFSWSRKFGPSLNKQNVTLRFTYGADTVSGTYVLARGGQAGNLSAPRNIKVENVVNRVKVTWDPPKFDGGETIIGYTMCAKANGSLCRNVSADGQGVFQNLATGRDYTITVAARTATRTGPEATAKQKVSPVEASVRINSRDGERIGVTSQVAGFKGGAKFRLEYAVAVPGAPASTWRWVAFPNVIADGNVNRGFFLPPADVDDTIAVRLVTPNGPAYSRLSRPAR